MSSKDPSGRLSTSGAAEVAWPRFPPLEPLEIHSGLVFGPRKGPLPAEFAIPEIDRPIREVLEEIVFPAVSRTPCLVAFSGGRDSSALLALVTHVARKHGFDDPIPITYVFDEHPRSREEEWQNLILRHLGLVHHEILRGPTAQLDSLGEIARRTLQRHGLFWPPNMHSLVPLVEAARDGALITGKGGDELFAPPERPPAFHWAIAKSLPTRRAVNYAISGLLPGRFGLRFKYRKRLALKWLRPNARKQVQDLFFRRFHETLTERETLFQFNESRYLETYRGVAAVLAQQSHTRLISPFVDPRFFAACIRTAPEGFGSRAAAMEALFGDLLPPAAPRRATKAVFTEVFWGPACRAFSSAWDGTGLDRSLICVENLRREWAKPTPDFRAVSPLQALWLHRHEQRVPEGNQPKIVPGAP